MKITKQTIMHWLSAKAKLAEFKKRESTLRQKIATMVLGDQQKGVKHEKMFGFKVSPTAKLNQTLDVLGLTENWKKLNAEEKACIRFKPEIINEKLKDLPEDSMLHKFVTYKPGMPELKITELAK